MSLINTILGRGDGHSVKLGKHQVAIEFMHTREPDGKPGVQAILKDGTSVAKEGQSPEAIVAAVREVVDRSIAVEQAQIALDRAVEDAQRILGN